MNEFLLVNNNLAYAVIALTVSIVILLILVLVSLMKNKKLRKDLEFFVNGDRKDGLEQMIQEYFLKVEAVDKKYGELCTISEEIQQKMKYCAQKIGVVRYNPYEEMGGNLCFAVAILDEFDNGVVLNGLYSRTGSFTYAKPIEGSVSAFILSQEEKEAIEKAKDNSCKISLSNLKIKNPAKMYKSTMIEKKSWLQIKTQKLEHLLKKGELSEKEENMLFTALEKRVTEAVLKVHQEEKKNWQDKQEKSLDEIEHQQNQIKKIEQMIMHSLQDKAKPTQNKECFQSESDVQKGLALENVKEEKATNVYEEKMVLKDSMNKNELLKEKNEEEKEEVKKEEVKKEEVKKEEVRKEEVIEEEVIEKESITEESITKESITEESINKEYIEESIEEEYVKDIKEDKIGNIKEEESQSAEAISRSEERSKRLHEAEKKKTAEEKIALRRQNIEKGQKIEESFDNMNMLKSIIKGEIIDDKQE